MPSPSHLTSLRQRFEYDEESPLVELKSVDKGVKWTPDGLPRIEDLPVAEAVGDIFNDSKANMEGQKSGVRTITTLEGIEASISIQAESKGMALLQDVHSSLEDTKKLRIKEIAPVVKEIVKDPALLRALASAVEVERVSGVVSAYGEIRSVSFHFSNGAVETIGFVLKPNCTRLKGFDLREDEVIIQIIGYGTKQLAERIVFVTSKGSKYSLANPDKKAPAPIKFSYKAGKEKKILGLKGSTSIVGIKEADLRKMRVSLKTSADEKTKAERYTRLLGVRNSIFAMKKAEFQRDIEAATSCGFCFADDSPRTLKEQYEREEAAFKAMEDKFIGGSLAGTEEDVLAELKRLVDREVMRQYGVPEFRIFSAALGAFGKDTLQVAPPRRRLSPSSTARIMDIHLLNLIRHQNYTVFLRRVSQLIFYGDKKQFGRLGPPAMVFKGTNLWPKSEEKGIYPICQMQQTTNDARKYGISLLIYFVNYLTKAIEIKTAKHIVLLPKSAIEVVSIFVKFTQAIQLDGEAWSTACIMASLEALKALFNFLTELPQVYWQGLLGLQGEKSMIQQVKNCITNFADAEAKSTSMKLPTKLADDVTDLAVQLTELETKNIDTPPVDKIITELKAMKFDNMLKVNSSIFIAHLKMLQRHIPGLLEKELSEKAHKKMVDTLWVGELIQVPEGAAGNSHAQINTRSIIALRGTPVVFADQVSLNEGRWYYEVQVMKQIKVRAGWYMQRSGDTSETALINRDVEPGLGADGRGFGLSFQDMLFWNDGKSEKVPRTDFPVEVKSGSIIGCEIYFDWKDVRMHYYVNGILTARISRPKGNITNLCPAVSCHQGGMVNLIFSGRELRNTEFVTPGYMRTFYDPKAEAEKKNESKDRKEEKEEEQLWSRLLRIQTKAAWQCVAGEAKMPPYLQEFAGSVGYISDKLVNVSALFLKVYEATIARKIMPIMQRYMYYGVAKQSGQDAVRFEIFFQYMDTIFDLAGEIFKAAAREEKMAKRVLENYNSIPLLSLLAPFIAEIGIKMQLLIQLPSIALRILPSLKTLMENFYAVLPRANWKRSAEAEIEDCPQHMILPQLLVKVLCDLVQGLISGQKLSILEIKNKWWLDCGLLSGGISFALSPDNKSAPLDTKGDFKGDVKDSKRDMTVGAWAWCPELCGEYVDLNVKLRSWGYNIPDQPKYEHWESGFLGDVFYNRGNAANLIKLIQRKHFNRRILNQHGGKVTARGVHAVFAVLLKHCHMEKMAIEAANKGKRYKPPSEIRNLWTEAFKIAKIGLNLYKADDAALQKFGSLEKFISMVEKRCRFLLLVSPTTHGPDDKLSSNMDEIGMAQDLLPARQVSSLKEDNDTLGPPPIVVRQKSDPKSKWRKVRALVKLKMLGRVTRRLRDMVSLRKRLAKQKVEHGFGLVNFAVDFVTDVSKPDIDLGRELSECLIKQRLRGTYRIAALSMIKEVAKTIAQDKIPGQSDSLMLLFGTYLASLFTPGSVNALVQQEKKPKVAKVIAREIKKSEDKNEELPPDTTFRINQEVIIHGVARQVLYNNKKGRVAGGKDSMGRYPVRGTWAGMKVVKFHFSNLVSPARFKVGARVKIHGLVKSANLNGVVGTIVGIVLFNGRYPVEAKFNRLSKSRKNLFPSNLKVIKAQKKVIIAKATVIGGKSDVKKNQFNHRHRFLPGDKVEVIALKSKGFQFLNGKKGIVAGPINFKGRYPVAGNWKGTQETHMPFKPTNLKLIERGGAETDEKFARPSHYLSQLQCVGATDSSVLSGSYYSILSLLLNNQVSNNSFYVLQVTAAINLHFESLDAIGLAKTKVASYIQKFLPFSPHNDQMESSFMSVATAWNTFRLITYYAYRKFETQTKKKKVMEEVDRITLHEVTELRDAVMDIIFTRLMSLMDNAGIARKKPISETKMRPELLSTWKFDEKNEQSLADASVCWFSLQCDSKRAHDTHKYGHVFAAINQFLWVVLRISSSTEGQRELAQKCWISLLSRVFYTTADHHVHGQTVTQMIQLSQTLVSRIFRRTLRLSAVPPELTLERSSEPNVKNTEFHSLNLLSDNLGVLYQRIGVFSLPLPFTPMEERNTANASSLQTWNVVVSPAKLLDLRRDLESSQACCSVVEDLVYLFRSLLAPITIHVELEGGMIQNKIAIDAYLGENIWQLKMRAAEEFDVDPVGLTLSYNFKEMKGGVLSDFRLFDNCLVQARIEDTEENKRLANEQMGTKSEHWAGRIEQLIIEGLRLIQPTLVELEDVAKMYGEKNTTLYSMMEAESKQARHLQRALEIIYASLTVLGGTIYRIREGGKVKYKGIGDEPDIGHVSEIHFKASAGFPLPDRVTISIGADDGQNVPEMSMGDVYALPDEELPFTFMHNKDEMIKIFEEVLLFKCPESLAKHESGIIHYYSLQRRILKIVSELLMDATFRKLFKERNLMLTLLKFTDGVVSTESLASLEHKALLLESIPVPGSRTRGIPVAKVIVQKEESFTNAQKEKIAMLQGMGFPRQRAIKALKAKKWDIPQSIDWICSHQESEELKSAVTGVQDKKQKSFRVNEKVVKLLTLLGASEADIEKAMRENDSNTRKAIIQLIKNRKKSVSNAGFKTKKAQSPADARPVTKDPRFHILKNMQEKMAFEEQEEKKAESKSPKAETAEAVENDLFLEKTSDIYKREYSLEALSALSRSQYLNRRIAVEKGLSAAYSRRGVTVFFENMDVDDETVLDGMINNGSIGALIDSLSKEGQGFEGFSGPFATFLRHEAQNSMEDAKAHTKLTDTLIAQLIASILLMVQKVLEPVDEKVVDELPKESMNVSQWIIQLFVEVVDHVKSVPVEGKSNARKNAYYEKIFPTELWNVMMELIHGFKGRARTEAILLFSSYSKAVPSGFTVKFPKTKVSSLVGMMKQIYKRQLTASTGNKGNRFSPFLQSLVELVVNLYLMSSKKDRTKTFPNVEKWFKDVVIASECMMQLEQSDMENRRLPHDILINVAATEFKRENMNPAFTREFYRVNNEVFTPDLDEELVCLVDVRDLAREPSTKKNNPFIDIKLLSIPQNEKHSYANMSAKNVTHKQRKYRFAVLKRFNMTMKSALPLINLSLPHGTSRLTDSVKATKHYLFFGTKEDLWNKALESTKKSIATSQTKARIGVFEASTLKEQKKVDWEGTLSQFGQLMQALKSKEPSFYRRPKNQRAFEVIFKGMHSHDAGGCYRQHMETIAQEIQSTNLPLFIQCPNARLQMGKNREIWVPRSMTGLYSGTRKKVTQMYEFVGQLMGLAIRTTMYMALNFSGVTWKPLCKEKVIMKDVAEIDALTMNGLHRMLNLERDKVKKEEFNRAMSSVKFEACLADGKVTELIPGGSRICVQWENRERYIKALTKLRTSEFQEQCEAMLRGLATVVPYQILTLFKWTDLRDQVCGRVAIDLKLLKSVTTLAGDDKKGKKITNNTSHIKHFWKMMEEMTNEERSKVLFFVWGRTRLPPNKASFNQKFMIQACPKSRKNPDKYLPISHTCFFQLELPEYSSVKIMREQVLKACLYCTEIDGDTTSTANRAAAMR